MPSRARNTERLRRLAHARLYFVCDSRPGGRELSEVIEQAVTGGAEVVQLREKLLDDAALLALAREGQRSCERLGALFVLNDRPDIAREAGADGVHVGQEDMPVGEVRELVGPEMLIGLSTHAPEEIEAVDTAAVDYIGVGPVHATPTKPGRPAVGLELVRYAVAHATVPFFAIGGIDEANLGRVLDAGATRVCVLRAIAEAADPRHAAHMLREQLEQGREPAPGEPATGGER